MKFNRLLFIFTAILFCFSINGYAANRISHTPSPKNENEVILLNTTPYYANVYASYSDGTADQILLYPRGTAGNLDKAFIDLIKQGYPPLQSVTLYVTEYYNGTCLLNTIVDYPGGTVTTDGYGCYGAKASAK